jgi:hypothetical protein
MNVKKEDVVESVRKYISGSPKLFLTYLPKEK